MCDSRDRFELKLVEKIIEQNKPIFRDCRGLQLLNVFFKGTLFQDIPTQYKKIATSHIDNKSRMINRFMKFFLSKVAC